MRSLPHDAQNPDGEEKFIEISDAYAILSDPLKRQRYDAGGYDEPTSSGGHRPHHSGARAGDFYRDFYAQQQEDDVPKGNMLRDVSLRAVKGIISGSMK